jgi:hypothetical protein
MGKYILDGIVMGVAIDKKTKASRIVYRIYDNGRLVAGPFASKAKAIEVSDNMTLDAMFARNGYERAKKWNRKPLAA